MKNSRRARGSYGGLHDPRWGINRQEGKHSTLTRQERHCDYPEGQAARQELSSSESMIMISDPWGTPGRPGLKAHGRGVGSNRRDVVPPENVVVRNLARKCRRDATACTPLENRPQFDDGTEVEGTVDEIKDHTTTHRLIHRETTRPGVHSDTHFDAGCTFLKKNRRRILHDQWSISGHTTLKVTLVTLCRRFRPTHTESDRPQTSNKFERSSSEDIRLRGSSKSTWGQVV